jgi:hypothetical protein
MMGLYRNVETKYIGSRKGKLYNFGYSYWRDSHENTMTSHVIKLTVVGE